MIRRWSVVLLTAALRLCPAETHDWGQAMVAELEYIEDSWAALCWAIGSAGVVLRRAVASALGKLWYGTEMEMKRPRILFSVGVALLPLAILFFAFMSMVAYRNLTYYKSVHANVVAFETSTRTSSSVGTAYMRHLKVEFESRGEQRSGICTLWTTDPREDTRWAHEYAVGTRHVMLLERRKPQPGTVRLFPEWAGLPAHRLITIALPIPFGAVLITAGMVYMGRRRAI